MGHTSSTTLYFYIFIFPRVVAVVRRVLLVEHQKTHVKTSIECNTVLSRAARLANSRGKSLTNPPLRCLFVSAFHFLHGMASPALSWIPVLVSCLAVPHSRCSLSVGSVLIDGIGLCRWDRRSRQVTPTTAGRSIATLICLRHTLRLIEPLADALEVCGVLTFFVGFDEIVNCGRWFFAPRGRGRGYADEQKTRIRQEGLGPLPGSRGWDGVHDFWRHACTRSRRHASCRSPPCSACVGARVGLSRGSWVVFFVGLVQRRPRIR